jgi:GTP-binding protein
MQINQVSFIMGATSPESYPPTSLPEYGFIGRSNVGKSSLINMLTGVKGIAKTSQTPGKTRQINFFLVNDNCRFCDLPGYGFARTSKTERSKLAEMIEAYIGTRSDLVCLFLLIDCRIPPQKIDLDYMEWLGRNEVPFTIVFTKIDKLSSSELGKNLAAYKKEMLRSWEELPEMIYTSSHTGLGRDQILNFVERMNKEFHAQKPANPEYNNPFNPK